MNFNNLFIYGLRKGVHLINFGRRIQTPGKIMRSLFIRHSRIIKIDDFDYDLSLQLNLQEHMQSRIFWQGYYNLDIVPVLKRILKPGMIVIDIGANIGEITLISAKLTGAEGRVLAFEPLERVANQLEQNVQQNKFSWVEIIRTGLSDFEQELPLYSSDKRSSDGSMNAGISSLYQSSERSVVADHIRLLPLDKYLEKSPIPKLDLIKIDIEGAELPCLRGAIITLKRFQPYIIIEVQHETARSAGYEALEIISFLQNLDYTFYRIKRLGELEILNELTAFQNVLCVPDGKALN